MVPLCSRTVLAKSSSNVSISFFINKTQEWMENYRNYMNLSMISDSTNRIVNVIWKSPVFL